MEYLNVRMELANEFLSPTVSFAHARFISNPGISAQK